VNQRRRGIVEERRTEFQGLQNLQRRAIPTHPAGSWPALFMMVRREIVESPGETDKRSQGTDTLPRVCAWCLSPPEPGQTPSQTTEPPRLSFPFPREGEGQGEGKIPSDPGCHPGDATHMMLSAPRSCKDGQAPDP
jgi:hypothetical protein